MSANTHSSIRNSLICVLSALLLLAGALYLQPSARASSEFFTISMPEDTYTVDPGTNITFMVDQSYTTNDTGLIEYYIWTFYNSADRTVWKTLNTTGEDVAVYFPANTAGMTFNSTVEAFSSSNGTAMDDFTVIVTGGGGSNTPPTLVVDVSHQGNGTYTFISMGIDEDGDELNYVTVISMDEENGSRVLYTMDGQDITVSLSPGTYLVTVTCSDGTDEATWTMELNVSGETQQSHLPVADIWVSDPTPEVGQDVIFDASDSSDPDGDELTYIWDHGDGVTFSGVRSTHAYEKEGRYTVMLQVSDGEHTSTASRSIHVVPVGEGDNRPPTISLSADPMVAKPHQNVGVKASANDPDGDELTFRWSASYGNGDEVLLNGSGEDTVWFMPARLGDVTVSAIAADREFTSTATITITVTGDGEPGDNGTGDTNTTINDTIPERKELDLSLAINFTSMDLSTSFLVTARDRDGNNTLNTSGDTYVVAWYFDGDRDHPFYGVSIIHTFERYGIHTSEVCILSGSGGHASAAITFILRTGEETDGGNSSTVNDLFNDTRENDIAAMITYTAGGLKSSEPLLPGCKVDVTSSIIGYLELMVSPLNGSFLDGTLLVINVDPSTMDTSSMDGIEVLVNGEPVTLVPIETTASYSGTRPYATFTEYDGQYQILVYVPPSSSSTVVVRKEAAASPGGEEVSEVQLAVLLLFTGLIMIAVAILVVLMVLKRKNKENFYDDYKTAREDGDPDIRVKGSADEEGWDEWDSFED